MKNYQKKKLEKLLIEQQLEKLKKVQADPNDIILNAAAFQQELIREMGIKKKSNAIFKFKRAKNSNITANNNQTGQVNSSNNRANTYSTNNNNNNENQIHLFLPKIINKTINEEKDRDIILRRKDFLNNLTLAQKIGLKEIPKMPLSIQEWRNIEAKTLQRNDHISSCPICLDDLSKRETMILSCTHIFHKVFCFYLNK